MKLRINHHQQKNQIPITMTLSFAKSEQVFAPNLTIQIGLGDLDGDGDGDKDIIDQHSVWFNQLK